MASTGTEDKKYNNNAVLSVEVLNWLAKYIKKPPPGETWRALFKLGDDKDLFVKVKDGTVFLQPSRAASVLRDRPLQPRLRVCGRPSRRTAPGIAGQKTCYSYDPTSATTRFISQPLVVLVLNKEG